MENNMNIPVTESELLKEIGRLQMELQYAEQKNRNNLDGYTKQGLKERLEVCKAKLLLIRESGPSSNKILLKG
jgi:hypothetical protein